MSYVASPSVSVNRQDRGDAWVFAGLTTLIVCLLWAGAYIVFSRSAAPAGLGFDGKAIVDGTINPIAQLRAYQLSVVALALLVLAAMALPVIATTVRRLTDAVGADALVAATSLAGALGLAGAIWFFSIPKMPPDTVIPPFAQWYSILALPSKAFYLASVAGSAVIVAVIAWSGIVHGRNWLWGLSLLLVLTLTLPGLFEPVTLVQIPPGTLQGVEAHFTGVIGSNQAANFDINRPVGYSLLVTLLKTAYEHLAGPMSFQAEIRSVQFGNLAFALACLAACYVWSRRGALAGIIIILLITPWVHNNHQGLFFPNQAGWRFLAFPLFALVLAASRPLPGISRPIALGIFAGLALIWNLETGIAILIATAVFIACRTELWRPAIIAGAACVVSGALAMAAALLVLFPLAGVTVFQGGAAVVRDYFGRLAVGDGYGLPQTFDVLAIVMATYAIWFIALAGFKRGAGTLSEETAFRAALAAAMLIWGAYYAARPDPWNLWSYLFFFGLLFSAGFLREASGLIGPGRAMPRIPTFAFILVVGPAIAAGQYQAAQTVWSGLRGMWDEPAGSVYVAGVRLPAADAARLASQAQEVSTAAAGTLVLTGNSHLLPKLSGRPELFLEKDAVFSHAYLNDYRHLVADIRKRKPARILLDDPELLPAGATHRRFFMQLQQDLAYQFEGAKTKSGWLDLRLVEGGSAAGQPNAPRTN